MTKYLVYMMSAMLFLAGCETQTEQQLTKEEQNQLNEDLISVASKGDTKKAKQLLDEGASAKAKTKTGWTAWLWASFHGHTDTAQLLLDHGAEVDAKTKDGWTALHFTAFNGHLDTAKLLLARHADKKATTNSGKTAERLALDKGHTEIAQIA